MSIITASDLSFNGEEIKSLSEAVFESTFAKPEITAFHNVVTGIVAKKQIAILGRIEGLLGKGSGECNPTSDTNTIPSTEKFWDPEAVSGRLTQCWTDLQETFYIWGLKNGIDKYDLTSTDFLNFVQERMQDAILESVYRFVWFGDKNAAAVDASPAGSLTSGTNPAYFNKINGLFQQIEAVVTADADRLTSGFDSRNGQSSYSLQAFDSSDTSNRVATNTLQNMEYGADFRLRGKAGAVYIVTMSVFDQYERELKDAQLSNYSVEFVMQGVKSMTINGRTIYGFDFWDRMIKAHYDDGSKYLRPHRAILVDPENLQVGVEEQGFLPGMDVIFDRTTKENHIDFLYRIDAKLILDYEVQAAW